MTSEFEEIFAADGTSRVLQHQRKDLPEYGSKALATLVLARFKQAWEDSALAVMPTRATINPNYLKRLRSRRTWITRFSNGRPYHPTASNRKRRKRYYRNR